MFRFFRKHRWLLIVVMGITAITFVFFMGSGPSRGGGGGRTAGNENYGSIYGKKITAEMFRDAQAGFLISYWFQTRGEWADKNPNYTPATMEREVYMRLMLVQKAKDLGIHVGDDAVVTMANNLLRSIGRKNQPVPLGDFVKRILQPRGLTEQDFQNFARESLVLEQLEQTLGLAGALVTPREAVAAYEREHQEISAQAVFFPASNYVSSVVPAPAAVDRFYSNSLAVYRLPVRVQVGYVAFEVSNYLAAAEQALVRTNLNEQIDAVYRQYGASAFPEAKTPADAKAQIRTELIRQRAIAEARRQANEFASAVFSEEPVRPENLSTMAKQKGLAVHVTAPFSAASGPEEFTASPDFVKAAFELTPDEPFAGPVAGLDGLYILAYVRQLPSEIPPLDQIRSRVTRDYQLSVATLLAWKAGTNFVNTLGGMTPYRGFAALCVGAGLQPQTLPPFSLSTRELPDLDETMDLDQLKNVAFTTPVGKISGLVTNSSGGFIIYVQSHLPVDQAKMNSELPQYLASFRRERLVEAFNQWANLEARRQLAGISVFHQQLGVGGVD